MTRVPHGKRQLYVTFWAVLNVFAFCFLYHLFMFLTHNKRFHGLRTAARDASTCKPIYTLTWHTYINQCAQTKCRRKRMKTNSIISPVSAASVLNHVYASYICLYHEILEKMFANLELKINK